jgi:hypothetical protein
MGTRNRKIEMISYLKDKYYWYNINQRLKKFLKGNEEQKILMYGYPKSGNTWLRFLLYNYRDFLINPGALETMTYDRLNSIQNNIMEKGTTFGSEDGFPIFYRTHVGYNTSYTLFDKKVFIHRNPLDTLVSSYYFYRNRKVPFCDDIIALREKLSDIDYYVVYKIDGWIDFYKESIQHADIVMNYSRMQVNCEEELVRLISFLDWDLNQELVRRTVEISSFNKVKTMGLERNQKHGMGPKDTFEGEFTRSGKEGQFYNELKKETINLVFKKFPEFKALYQDCLE